MRHRWHGKQSASEFSCIMLSVLLWARKKYNNNNHIVDRRRVRIAGQSWRYLLRFRCNKTGIYIFNCIVNKSFFFLSLLFIFFRVLRLPSLPLSLFSAVLFAFILFAWHFCTFFFLRSLELDNTERAESSTKVFNFFFRPSFSIMNTADGEGWGKGKILK